MSEKLFGKEQESTPLDISEEVQMIVEAGDIDGVPRTVRLNRLMRELRNAPSLTLTLPWDDSLNLPRWAKARVEGGVSVGQERSATIICSESQKRQEANAFESGVKWVSSKGDW